jgi:hypothetical protein
MRAPIVERAAATDNMDFFEKGLAAHESSRLAPESNRFLITSLPRCGSTSLARILNSHAAIRCLVEPFHPRRYRGVFYRSAIQNGTVNYAMEAIWRKFTGIKHVWEASGWPFAGAPGLNRELCSYPAVRIVALIRRNYFRRFISNFICRQTNYWIGTKEEFEHRVSKLQFKPLDPERVRDAILRDAEAASGWISYMDAHQIRVYKIIYEDFFRPDATPLERYQNIDGLLAFLGYSAISMELFEERFAHNYEPDLHRWASMELYRRIPNADELERAVGCEKTGWLFKEP